MLGDNLGLLLVQIVSRVRNWRPPDVRGGLTPAIQDGRVGRRAAAAPQGAYGDLHVLAGPGLLQPLSLVTLEAIPIVGEYRLHRTGPTEGLQEVLVLFLREVRVSVQEER